MKRIIVFSAVLLFLFSARVFGQKHYIVFPSNQFKVKENNYYSYNYTIHSFPYGAPIHLDTLNNCRVRRNKIRSVAIYQFYSATDSAYIAKVEYDSSGLTGYLRNLYSENDIKRIQCDSLCPERNVPNKITRKKSFDFKEKWRTDKDGYIVEYKRINKGLFNKIIGNWIGIPNKKVVYTYDSLHLSVTEAVYFSRNARFKKQGDIHYEYKLDSKGDLLSEFCYDKNENGVMELTSGYTYHYEYYQQ